MCECTPMASRNNRTSSFHGLLGSFIALNSSIASPLISALVARLVPFRACATSQQIPPPKRTGCKLENQANTVCVHVCVYVCVPLSDHFTHSVESRRRTANRPRLQPTQLQTEFSTRPYPETSPAKSTRTHTRTHTHTHTRIRTHARTHKRTHTHARARAHAHVARIMLARAHQQQRFTDTK